ncbi:MAG: LEA14-like dessication related protein [Gammaproteobacteria bacterium]|jgi:LEA14-like dessication related protein
MIRILAIIFLITFIIVGCAGMPSDFEEPALSVTNIALRNSTGLTPEFDIVLNITNPNREPLDIDGMSYEIYLEGNKVVSGVSNNFPLIEPYSEVDVNVKAKLNLLESINLLRDLTKGSQNNIGYKLIAKLDIGRSYPRIHIQKTGIISL